MVFDEPNSAIILLAQVGKRMYFDFSVSNIKGIMIHRDEETDTHICIYIYIYIHTLYSIIDISFEASDNTGLPHYMRVMVSRPA